MVLVVIDSRKREGTYDADGITPNLPNTTPRNDYIFKFNKNLNKIQNMKLKHASIPRHPLIITGYNDQFLFEEDSGAGFVQLIATIPPGYYTTTSYTAALIAAMITISAGGNNYVGSWDSTTNRISINKDGTLNDNIWRVNFRDARSAVSDRHAFICGGDIENVGPSPAGTAVGVLTYQMQMNSPRYYIVEISTGFNGNNSVMTDTRQFTFVVPCETKELYSMTDISENGSFSQSDRVLNGFTNFLHVRIFYENDQVPCEEWSNLDHVLIVELEQGGQLTIGD